MELRPLTKEDLAELTTTTVNIDDLMGAIEFLSQFVVTDEDGNVPVLEYYAQHFLDILATHGITYDFNEYAWFYKK